MKCYMCNSCYSEKQPAHRLSESHQLKLHGCNKTGWKQNVSESQGAQFIDNVIGSACFQTCSCMLFMIRLASVYFSPKRRCISKAIGCNFKCKIRLSILFFPVINLEISIFIQLKILSVKLSK